MTAEEIKKRNSMDITEFDLAKETAYQLALLHERFAEFFKQFEPKKTK